MERVAMDILGPLPLTDQGNKYILVDGDYFTKWTEEYPLPNQEASAVATVFVEQFVSRNERKGCVQNFNYHGMGHM